MRREQKISIPILLLAIGEIFLIAALYFRGTHKAMLMYASGLVAIVFMITAVVELVRKNRRKS